MNRYVIAPKVVKVALDPELTAQFSKLNSRLTWRTLTTNLESCEDPPNLYFRVTLKLKAGNTTYAGFATGAPFMLTRDKDVAKRAFFLRHWVRKAPENDCATAPLVALPHMSIAAQDNELLLIRVNIDRPLASEDIFKSVPFATWMFQVVQVDAVIQDRPGIRFAFAIERTVTGDERDVVSSSGQSLSFKGPRLKQTTSPHVLPRPSSIPPPQAQHAQAASRQTRPLTNQRVVQPQIQPNMIHRQNAGYTPVNPRPPAAAYQPNPYAYASNRPVGVQMRQNVAPRPPYLQQQQEQQQQQRVKTMASRPYNRSGNSNTGTSSAQQTVDQQRPVMHPYLRLWEDRNLDDPYEPFFVTEDDEFDKKAKRSWVIEETPQYAKQFDYQKLFGIPTADYPPYYFSGPASSDADGEPDIEVIVQRKKRVKPVPSEVTGISGQDKSHARFAGVGKYSSAVVAASEYNSMLRDDRSQLRKWLVEDVQREEEESEQEEEEDDGDGDYSD